MPKKRASAPDVSRLRILAAGDDAAFDEHAGELLHSGDRLGREAALDALAERPIAGLRPRLRALYDEVDGDAGKRDPAAHVRAGIVRVLLALADTRDLDIGLRAAETFESVNGTDGTSPLRSLGLKLLAATDRDLLPYIAVEHVNHRSEFNQEPANTALQLLAGAGNELSVYQCLFSKEDHEPELVAAAFEFLADAPAMVMSRLIAKFMASALVRRDEWLLTTIAETVVKREVEDAYGSLAAMMAGRVSDELYGYVAMLLASTNRAPLLAILDEQMHDVRRRMAIVAALRVRTTPEQEAILRRWEGDGDGEPAPRPPRGRARR
jgi:hypothetical protein